MKMSVVDKLPAVLLRPFDTLGRRLVVLFAIVLLPPTVLSLYLAWTAFEEQSDRARLSVRQFASLVSAYERDFFNDTERLLFNLAADPVIRQLALPDCEAVLHRALETSPEYMSLSVTDRDGGVICSTVTTDDVESIEHRTWFQEAVASSGFTLSDYTVSQDLAEPVIVAAVRVYDDRNEVRGVIHVEINLQWLNLFVRASGIPPEGSVFLLDKNGILLTSREFNLGPIKAGVPDDATLQQVASRDLIDFEAIGNDGRKRVYSSVALPHGNVIVLFGLPSEITLGWIQRDLLTRLLSLAAIWLAGVMAAVIGARLWVTRWISRLRRTARSYSCGDFSARVDFDHAPIELRDLGTTLVNMAERLQAREEDLHQSLEQKDTLLKEIHHRVKNNLQTISSLLNIQMRSVAPGQAHQALEEVQTRVRALALVHHYLYESEDVRFVDLKLFVGELCQVLHDTLRGARQNISIETDVGKTMITSDRAVPIALLITEAITNSYKHAFPDGRAGKISVVIRKIDQATARLSISDDGVGYRDGEELAGVTRPSTGVGTSLISAFARQLGDELTYEGPPGTTISLRLRLQAEHGASKPSVVRAPPEKGATETRVARESEATAPVGFGSEVRPVGKA